MSPPAFDPLRLILPFSSEEWQINEERDVMDAIGRAFEALVDRRQAGADRPGGRGMVELYGEPGLESWEGAATIAHPIGGGLRRLYITEHWGCFVRCSPVNGVWSVLDCLATTPRDCASEPGSTELDVDVLLQRLDADGGEQPLAADLAARIRELRQTEVVRARDLGTEILWGAELMWNELVEAAFMLGEPIE